MGYVLPAGLSGSGVTAVAVVTAAQYAALTPPHPTTLYLVVG